LSASTKTQEALIQEAAELLVLVIGDLRQYSPDQGKFMYGDHKDLSRQWLKPLWDLIKKVEQQDNVS
jgi:hypothetical protein